MKRMGRRGPLEARLWARVSGGDYTECWLWTGRLDHGYGRIRVGGPDRRTRQAHRVAYELMVGPIPDGLQLDHLCRNRACVNPWHLEPVTPQVNSIRGLGPLVSCAKKRAQTHCIHGHLFDEANTYVRRDGTRFCRTCGNERTQAARRLNGRRAS